MKIGAYLGLADSPAKTNSQIFGRCGTYLGSLEGQKVRGVPCMVDIDKAHVLWVQHAPGMAIP
jgi:hypothetical protein